MKVRLLKLIATLAILTVATLLVSSCDYLNIAMGGNGNNQIGNNGGGAHVNEIDPNEMLICFNYDVEDICWVVADDKERFDEEKTKLIITSAEVESYDIYGIKDNGFKGYTNLKSVVIGEGVKVIGDSAFEDCQSLESVVIPASVTHIGASAFAGCRSLKSVIIEGDSQLTKIEANTFEWCSALTDFVIPDNVNAIGESAFFDCESLSEIVIPSNVTVISEGAFRHGNGRSED